ncbi:hypothetical protein Golob_006136, partial [Gossypium lobatum]|nr:hypothetical protein [Gossypium lobatum]
MRTSTEKVKLVAKVQHPLHFYQY